VCTARAPCARRVHAAPQRAARVKDCGASEGERSNRRALARRRARVLEARSIALNTAEGSGCSGGTRRERYRNALGSARETGACLDVALALGYVDQVDDKLLDALDHVRATLFRVVR
jgi:four helix bundle protein